MSRRLPTAADVQPILAWVAWGAHLLVIVARLVEGACQTLAAEVLRAPLPGAPADPVRPAEENRPRV